MMVEIGAVNYVGVLAASIVAFAAGAIWHGPLFGKRWMKLMGFNEKSIKGMEMTPQKAMALGFVTTVVSAFVLAHFVSGTQMAGALMVSFLFWLGFGMPFAAEKYLWEGKPFELSLISGGYRLISFLLMGAVLVLVG